MEITLKRTLVKSAPELWELADDRERMEAWMAGLVGAEPPLAVEVTGRDPERSLAWRATSHDVGDAAIALELAESGFGTAVSITARAPSDAGAADAALERLLDELGSPERRPFSRD